MNTEFKQCSFEDFYDVYDQIGNGHFAIVRECIEKATGNKYAAKFMRKQRTAGSRRGVPISDIIREVDILKSVSHPNIVHLHDVYENEEEVVIILELIQGGELFAHMAEKERLCEKDAIAFMRAILLGVEHLHSNNIAHLDLKPENVLLCNRNECNIKLIDFGLSQKLSPTCEFRSMRGTPEFVAPEVVNYEPLTLATDMWSVGVIAYIMISGASPFLGDSNQETFSNITAINYFFDEEYFLSSSDLLKDFISDLLVRDPRKRLTVENCLNHPWIQNCHSPLCNYVPLEILCSNSEPAEQAKQRWKHSLDIVIFLIKLSKGASKKLSSVNHCDGKNQSCRVSVFIFCEKCLRFRVGGSPMLSALSAAILFSITSSHIRINFKAL